MRTSLVPWTSRLTQPVEEFRREISPLMSWFDRRFEGLEPLQHFSPIVNVAETDSGYEITAELPGMNPDDIDIELKHGDLWISGERKEEKEESGKTYHVTESRYGQFRRLIPLDEDADPEKIDAEYKDGVLTINVSKSKTACTKRIKVRT